MIGPLLNLMLLAVPAENVAPGQLLPKDSAEALSKQLLAAVQADDPSLAKDQFFPAEPFDQLKAIAKPREYWNQLMKWYDADIHREAARVKDKGPLTFDGFRFGGCKWKAKGSEGNAIAYWSCYSNHFYAKTTGAKPERLDFKLRAVINWGATWYVTHFGPIPPQPK